MKSIILGYVFACLVFLIKAKSYLVELDEESSGSAEHNTGLKRGPKVGADYADIFYSDEYDAVPPAPYADN